MRPTFSPTSPPYSHPREPAYCQGSNTPSNSDLCVSKHTPSSPSLACLTPCSDRQDFCNLSLYPPSKASSKPWQTSTSPLPYLEDTARLQCHTRALRHRTPAHPLESCLTTAVYTPLTADVPATLTPSAASHPVLAKTVTSQQQTRA